MRRSEIFRYQCRAMRSGFGVSQSFLLFFLPVAVGLCQASFSPLQSMEIWRFGEASIDRATRSDHHLRYRHLPMKKVQCGKSRGWTHQPERMGITYETSEHQTSQLSWCPRTRDYAPSLLTAGPNDAWENTFTNAILGAGHGGLPDLNENWRPT